MEHLQSEEPFSSDPYFRKFDIFRWGHYLKNFKFYVPNIIQGRTLYKGGYYLRKYGSLILSHFYARLKLRPRRPALKALPRRR